MRYAKPALRKIGILMVGIPLLVFGLILIPLPGPGLLVCLAALLVLSREFDWARRSKNFFREKFMRAWEASRRPEA